MKKLFSKVGNSVRYKLIDLLTPAEPTLTPDNNGAAASQQEKETTVPAQKLAAVDTGCNAAKQGSSVPAENECYAQGTKEISALIL